MKNWWAEGARLKFTLRVIVPAPEQERNVSPRTKDVSAHYLDSLWLLGMKMTAPNLTRRDGNLSDKLNNLLMQKLKGLSVSLGGREESKVAYNEADVWSKRAWRCMTCPVFFFLLLTFIYLFWQPINIINEINTSIVINIRESCFMILEERVMYFNELPVCQQFAYRAVLHAIKRHSKWSHEK